MFFKELLRAITSTSILLLMAVSTISYANDKPYDPNNDNKNNKQNNYSQNTNTPQNVEHAPNIVIVPSNKSWQDTNKLFNKSNFDNLDKPKKLHLFKIPDLREQS